MRSCASADWSHGCGLLHFESKLHALGVRLPTLGPAANDTITFAGRKAVTWREKVLPDVEHVVLCPACVGAANRPCPNCLGAGVVV